MSRMPLMPKATAVWLVENTSLTFDQIAEFCQLHVLEVKGIADGDVAHGIKGMDPISSGQLSREEIQRAQEDSKYHLKISEPKVQIPVVKTKKGPKYTPVSRRQDRPNAILWLLRQHPELRDSQIMRLVGTTKPTIESIRERTHWNSANLQPADPVTLALCTQTDLDREVKRAARRVERERKAAEKEAIKAGTLLPTEETAPTRERKKKKEATLVTAAELAAHKEATEAAALALKRADMATAVPADKTAEEQAADAKEEAESVFAKLGELKQDTDEDAKAETKE
ncbi:MAG: cell cycle transcriptional regulator TrcR [Pseudomonadota bacterium]